MPCAHTSYDVNLRCRTCGEMMGAHAPAKTATQVMAEQIALNNRLLAEAKADRQHRLEVVYGYQYLRPHAEAKVRALWADAFPQPPIQQVATPKERKPRPSFLLVGGLAASFLSYGLISHSFVWVGGVVGFAYMAGVALYDRTHIFGLGETVKREMRDYRESLKPPVRCAVIATHGFGGWR